MSLEGDVNDKNKIEKREQNDWSKKIFASQQDTIIQRPAAGRPNDEPIHVQFIYIILYTICQSGAAPQPPYSHCNYYNPAESCMHPSQTKCKNCVAKKDGG